jgi:hypothetical protein
MGKVRFIVVIAMVILTIVSMSTTYLSLKLSVLPGPTVSIPMGEGKVWECSWMALGLSVAIGLMLFALKLAIIDEHKRLNILGLVGLMVVAFISISFNMDVFYRAADEGFFLRHTSAKMKSQYQDYMAQVQTALSEKRETLLKKVARQEGELEAEVEGLREAPEGYGQRAKKEDYTLKLLQKEAEVELATLEEAKIAKAKADTLLLSTSVGSLDEIAALENEIRVACKDVQATVGIPLPAPVRQERPLFAVFAKLFSFAIGPMEILVLLLAFLLDIGDIVGYSLVPDKPKERKRPSLGLANAMAGPEIIPAPEESGIEFLEDSSHQTALPEVVPPEAASGHERPFRVKRPF